MEELKLQAKIIFQSFIADYLLDFLDLPTENSDSFYNKLVVSFDFWLESSNDSSECLIKLKEIILEEAYEHSMYSDSFEYLPDILEGAFGSKFFQKVEIGIVEYYEVKNS